MYCTQCNINWGALWNADDDEGDEQYVFCPCCNSDMFLEIVRPNEPTYMAVKLSGKIVSIETGQEMWSQPVIGAPALVRKMKMYTETYDEFQRRQELEEDKQIDLYQELRKTHSNEDAWRLSLQQREKVKRNFIYNNE